MGVLSCFRLDCENIMCDDLIFDIGYICKDCQEEFRNYVATLGYNVTPTKEMLMRDLENFRYKDKVKANINEAIDSFFQENIKRIK